MCASVKSGTERISGLAEANSQLGRVCLSWSRGVWPTWANSVKLTGEGPRHLGRPQLPPFPPSRPSPSWSTLSLSPSYSPVIIHRTQKVWPGPSLTAPPRGVRLNFRGLRLLVFCPLLVRPRPWPPQTPRECSSSVFTHIPSSRNPFAICLVRRETDPDGSEPRLPTCLPLSPPSSRRHVWLPGWTGQSIDPGTSLRPWSPSVAVAFISLS